MKRKWSVDMLEHIQNKRIEKIGTICIDTIDVVGMYSQSSVKKNNLKEDWKQFLTYKSQISELGEICYSICETNENVYNSDEDISHKQFLAVQDMLTNLELIEPLCRNSIPGGKYVVFRHYGSLHTLMLSYSYIWGTWAVQKKEVVDITRKDFEVYDKQFLEYDNPNSCITIYIPIS